MKSESTMNGIVREVGPCEMKTKRHRFKTLVSSIVSQQISGAAARTIWGRLENAAGTITPASLSAFDIDELRALGVSRQKATYILDLSQKTLDGEVKFQRFVRMSDEEIIEQLIQIKGIGKWTAQMFLMFSLARPDVLPVDDLGIKTAIMKNYRLRKLPDAKKIQKLATPWRPYATIASWYLWRSLE